MEPTEIWELSSRLPPSQSRSGDSVLVVVAPVHEGDAELLALTEAGDAPRLVQRVLQRRQQEAGEDGDDGDDD
ncbi:MAG: hypothetical protein ACYTGH_15160 [Planctomycetota bacterium]